jgi:putative membrane protein (TIGR04086 family)
VREKSLALPLNMKPVFRGLIVTYLMIIILSTIFSMILHFTSLSEIWIQPLGVAITTISLFFGGRSSAKSAGSKGLLQGLIIGISFILIMILFSAFNEIAWSTIPVKLFYALVAASVGGISGVK